MTDATAYKQVSYSKASVCRLFFIAEYFTCVCEVFRLHERLLSIKHLNVEGKTGYVFPCIEQGMNNFSLFDIFPNVITEHVYFISFYLFTCVLKGQYYTITNLSFRTLLDQVIVIETMKIFPFFLSIPYIHCCAHKDSPHLNAITYQLGPVHIFTPCSH